MPSPSTKPTATRPKHNRRFLRGHGRRWPYFALTLAFCVALALIGFTATRGWETVAIDGWGTALLFTIGWGTINYYVTVARPAHARLRNAVTAILAEL